MIRKSKGKIIYIYFCTTKIPLTKQTPLSHTHTHKKNKKKRRENGGKKKEDNKKKNERFQ